MPRALGRLWTMPVLLAAKTPKYRLSGHLGGASGHFQQEGGGPSSLTSQVGSVQSALDHLPLTLLNIAQPRLLHIFEYWAPETRDSGETAQLNPLSWVIQLSATSSVPGFPALTIGHLFLSRPFRGRLLQRGSPGLGWGWAFGFWSFRLGARSCEGILDPCEISLDT